MTINIHYIRVVILILICLSMNTITYSDDSNNYLVIELDEFPQVNTSNTSGFDKAVLGRGRMAQNTEILPVSVKVYPLGKPLQVVKSYVPGNSDEVDDVSRYLSDTTSRYVPEINVGLRNSVSSAEYIDRMFVSLHYPVNNNFSFGLSVGGGVFDLIGENGEPSISTGVTQVALEGKYKVNTEINLYGAVVLASTHSVMTTGLRGRIEYINRGGVELRLLGNLWTPWDENTVAVYNNGRTSGLRAEAILPLSRKFRLDLNAGVDGRYSAKSSFGIKGYEGTEFSAGGRLSWDFFKREYRQMPVEFLGQEYLNFERVTSRIGLFASLQASAYTGRSNNDDNEFVPVTRESVDQRIGVSADYAFNKHFGANAEIYVGYDPAREIEFGRLYGFDTRLVYIPTARLRFYGEFALDSEAATGIVEGYTWYYGAGMNYKF